MSTTAILPAADCCATPDPLATPALDDFPTPDRLKATVRELQVLGYSLWQIRNVILPDIARRGTAQCSPFLTEPHTIAVERTLPWSVWAAPYDAEIDLDTWALGPETVAAQDTTTPALIGA